MYINDLKSFYSHKMLLNNRKRENKISFFFVFTHLFIENSL